MIECLRSAEAPANLAQNPGPPGFSLGACQASTSGRDTPKFPRSLGVSRFRAIASTVAGGAAPGNDLEERSDFLPDHFRSARIGTTDQLEAPSGK